MKRYRAWPVTALSVAAFAAAAREARAQRDDAAPALAVLYFTNGAVGDAQAELQPLAAGIAGLLVAELSGNAKLRVVGREELRRVMDSRAAEAGGRVDRETAVRVGRILGVRHVIFGGLTTDGRGTLRLDVRAVSVETGQTEYAEAAQGRQDDLPGMIAHVAAKLGRGLRLPDVPKDARRASAERARRVSFHAVMLYSRAIAASDAGQAAEAAQLLEQALAEAPDLEAARRELSITEASRGER